MQLSVIIVNYNSKKLLENCLYSLQKANKHKETEVIVMDNNSGDGTIIYLKPLFPSVIFISNNSNVGFAKACNQGFRNSSGKHLLFLNPDTVLSNNCLEECISFLDSNNDTGAVGVRMVDGNGNFLKESKRGFPSPLTSFYKLFGFTFLFPRSKLFAKYYMGHLPEKENNLVEVLSGAFMMIKREVYEKAGGFDEDFFMYGEDVDLSSRILQNGYKNYYLGKISMTHLKGGSTTFNKKYVEDFYGSMKHFVKKHYKGRSALFRAFLYTGIEFRKILTKVSLLFR